MNFKRLLITASFVAGIMISVALLVFAKQASAEVDTRGGSGEGALPPQWHGGTSHELQVAPIWNILTIPYGGDFESVGSLVMDSSSQPHISFVSNCDEEYYYCDLMYASRDDAGWHFQTIDSVGLDSLSSLALDAGGNPHISYCGYMCIDLLYAYLDNTGWHIQELDYHGFGNSLALGSSDYPHISYIDDSLLRYAYQQADGWHYQTVDSEVNGFYTSLSLDGGGFPHISYSKAGNLMHAYLDGNGWHLHSVDTAGYSSSPSLVMDAEDHAHISYSRGYVPSLRYAHQDESGWHLQIVDSDEIRNSFLTLDADGNPHISYYDFTSKSLRYAYHDLTGWSIETVDSEGYEGPIAVDSNGLPHISYETDDAWKHAYKALPVTPTAVSLSGPISGVVDHDYRFIAAVSPISASLPIQYRWQATGQTPMTHTGYLTDSAAFAWELPGTKSITITASNPLGTVSDTHLITLTDIPILGLSAWNDSPSVRGRTTKLSASVAQGSNALYEWDFGDQTSGYGSEVTHVYSDTGTYTATVMAYNTISTHTTTTVTSTFGMFMPLISKASIVDVYVTSSGCPVMCYPCTCWMYGYIQGRLSTPVYSTVVGIDVTDYPYCEPPDECEPHNSVRLVDPAFPATLPGQINPFSWSETWGKHSISLNGVHVESASATNPGSAVYYPVTVVKWNLNDKVVTGTVRNDSGQVLQDVRVVVTADKCTWKEATLTITMLQPGQETDFLLDYFYCETDVTVVGQGKVEP